MPRRKARARARPAGLSFMDAMNIGIRMGVGPDGGIHDPCYRNNEEVIRLARLWHRHREQLIPSQKPGSWALWAFEGAERPRLTPDSRLIFTEEEIPNLDELEAHRQECYDAQTEAAREEFARLSGPTPPDNA